MTKEIALSLKVLFVVVVITFIVTIVIGYKFYQEYKSRTATASIPKSEISQLVEAVGKITDLPPEIPTIATVTDKNKLAKYPFFQKAEAGDRVLIYNQAKKAYLFRPTTGKLIEVGPIEITEQQVASSSAEVAGTASSSAALQINATVTLLNGTKGSGVANKAQVELEGVIKNIEVTQKGNTKNDYVKTVIAIKNPVAKAQAEQIAKKLNATVEPLPEGELEPKTDIVVFLGNDRL